MELNTVDIYVRVSTTEQAEEGYSVQEQEARLRAYCQAMNYKINAVRIDPGYSGANLDRPGIQQVISDIKAHRCQKVVVWKLDRLSRSQKDTMTLLEDVFQANGCSFISMMEQFDTSTAFGRCMIGILAAFAQMERENIKARTMMGKKAALSAGKFITSRAPIGYRFETKSDGTKILAPDPVFAPMIRDMYTMVVSGRTFGETARAMLDKYPWNLDPLDARNRITTMIRRPIYKGMIQFGDTEYKSIFEPLVDDDVWNAANAIVSKNVIESNKNHSQINGLLTGFIYCGKCGARVFPRLRRTVRKYTCYSVFRGMPTMVKSLDCDNRAMLVNELDQYIVDTCKGLATDRAVFDKVMIAPASEGPDLAALEASISAVDRKINRLLDLYASEAVGLEDIASKLKELKAERVGIQSAIDTAQKEKAGLPAPEALWTVAQSVEALEASGDRQSLRAAIHQLINRVEVYNGEIAIHWNRIF